MDNWRELTPQQWHDWSQQRWLWILNTMIENLGARFQYLDRNN